MRGDLVFYLAGANPFDRLVARATNGPYVHVGVEDDADTLIDARSRVGVTRHPFTRVGLLVVPVRNYGASEADVARGLAWLTQRVDEHARYSLADIADHLPLLVRLGVVLGLAHGFDCSDLVARYLDVAGLNRRGGIFLGTLDDNPGQVSPNDIARAAGLLH